MSPLRHGRRFLADRAGGAAVEAALALPIAFVFILGIFQLGWGIFLGSDVRHAIERAARAYIVTPTTTDQAFQSAVAANLMAAKINDVTLTISKSTSSGTQLARIAWTYRYTLQIPFVAPVVLNFDSQIIAPVRSP
ncbi:MAG: pilus assembly protein [Proteobacteria bacterium]|nr:pilus assembly protein [Pseudomonadota bacterium]